MPRFPMYAPSRFPSLWPISTREIRDFVARSYDYSIISMEIGVHYTFVLHLFLFFLLTNSSSLVFVRNFSLLSHEYLHLQFY